MPHKRRICFITGSRAEFGLMESTLVAIRNRSNLDLQIIATGMHLSDAHGKSLELIRRAGWKIDAVVPWKSSNDPLATAAATGTAISDLTKTVSRLRPDILLIVGDRVEAFAAAALGQIAGIIVAHVHGGDRAMGQADDSLRHAITKLSHIHFPATIESARRIRQLGEQVFRIHRVGSPGVDGIVREAADPAVIHRLFGVDPGEFAVLVLHPADANPKLEFSRAEMIYSSARKFFQQLIVVYPNNDPGSAGIIRCWRKHERDRGSIFLKNVARPTFLGLQRDGAMLIGNSSAGIIEAASFGMLVIDIGPRQSGRQRSGNVVSVSYNRAQIEGAIAGIWQDGHARRFRGKNIYASPNTARKIAGALANISLDVRLRKKLIAY